MKKISQSIIILLSVALSQHQMIAQTSSEAVDRQVQVERAFTPIIQDATKINTLPEIQTNIPSDQGVKYVMQQPQIQFASFPVSDTGPGNGGTKIDYSKKRGYFIAGVGHNINLDGRFGYRVVDEENDRLDFFASYNSANSEIDYLNQDYLYKSAKGKYSDAYAKVKYQHLFDPSILSLNASYLNTMYNYYGNSFWNPSIISPVFPYNLNKQQAANVFGGEAKLESKEDLEFSYLAQVKFDHFANKYGFTLEDKGVKGDIFQAKAGVGTTFDSDKTVNLEFELLHQMMNEVSYAPNQGFRDMTSLGGTGGFGMEGKNWKAQVGARLQYVLDIKNQLAIAPKVHAELVFEEYNKLYADLKGGINHNTYTDILLENRYAGLRSRVGYSYTLYDGTLGVKIGAIQGTEIDVWGGYKHTKDDHLYYSVNRGIWGNTSDVMYADLSEGTVGTKIKTDFIMYTNLTLGASYHYYNLKYTKDRHEIDNNNLFAFKKTAFGRPRFTFEASINVKPTKPMTLSLNYLLKGGRQGYNGNLGRMEKMQDINELNFRTDYQFMDWLTANLAFNNILNKKYETLLGYTHQGFNVMAGVSLKF